MESNFHAIRSCVMLNVFLGTIDRDAWGDLSLVLPKATK